MDNFVVTKYLNTARELGTYKAVCQWYKQETESVIKELSSALSSGDINEIKNSIEFSISNLRFNVDSHGRRVAECEEENKKHDSI